MRGAFIADKSTVFPSLVNVLVLVFVDECIVNLRNMEIRKPSCVATAFEVVFGHLHVLFDELVEEADICESPWAPIKL